MYGTLEQNTVIVRHFCLSVCENIVYYLHFRTSELSLSPSQIATAVRSLNVEQITGPRQGQEQPTRIS